MRGVGPITPKEMEVLSQMAELRTYKDISVNLGISIRTLYDHIYSIMLKTGTNRKEEVIKYAQEHGYGSKVSA